ncbi:MAG TPA: phage holin family protein [Croceibacterium sp.]|nr:phage holin family protein [Croceibacterium sp.]
MRDEDPLPETGEEADERSLLDDVGAAIEDGKTYLEAELAYQRTRAAFAADRAKDAAVFAALGGALALLALVALTIGLVIALVPLLTAWGAAAVVTGAWLALSVVFLRMAAARWRRLIGMFLSNTEREE